MLKRHLGAALIALFSFLAPSSATLHAQMSPSQEQPSVLAEIRTAIQSIETSLRRSNRCGRKYTDGFADNSNMNNSLTAAATTKQMRLLHSLEVDWSAQFRKSHNHKGAICDPLWAQRRQ